MVALLLVFSTCWLQSFLGPETLEDLEDGCLKR